MSSAITPDLSVGSARAVSMQQQAAAAALDGDNLPAAPPTRGTASELRRQRISSKVKIIRAQQHWGKLALGTQQMYTKYANKFTRWAANMDLGLSFCARSAGGSACPKKWIVLFANVLVAKEGDIVCGESDFIGRGLKPSTMGNYMSALSAMHKKYDLPDPFADNDFTREISAIRNNVPYIPRKSGVLNMGDFMKLREKWLRLDRFKGLQLWVMTLMNLYLGFRPHSSCVLEIQWIEFPKNPDRSIKR
eukprot:501363_1